MAAATKYRLEAYSDKYNDVYRVDIQAEGYTGPVYSKSIGANKIKLEKTDGIIQRTSLLISIQADTNFEFIEFFQYNTQQFKTILYKNDIAIWSGYVVAESYSEPYINPPYDVDIVATDGLGFLENYTFDNDGMQSYLQAIQFCLAKLNLGLAYSIAIDLFEENNLTTRSLLEQTYFDGSIFNGETCKSVIESLLPFGAIITQHKNRWLIRRPFEDIEKTHFLYNSLGIYTGTETGETVRTLGIYGAGADVWPRGSSPLLTLEHARRDVEVKEIYGTKKSIIGNSDFSKFALSLFGDTMPTGYPLLKPVYFENWESQQTLYTYTTSNPLYFPFINMEMALTSMPDDMAGITVTSYFSANVIKPLMVADSVLKLKIAFDYFVGSPVHVYVMIKCGANFLYADQTWSTTENVIDLGINPVNDDKGNIIIHHFEIISNGITSGNLEIRFFHPLSSSGNFLWHISNFSANIIDVNGVTFPESSEYVLGIREESSHKTEKLELKPVDLPDILNAESAYNNGKYRKSGSDYIPTLNWINNSKPAAPMLNVLQAQLINYYGDPKQTLTGCDWRGPNLHLNSVIKHAKNYNRVFIAEAGTWNILADEFSINWREKWMEFESIAYCTAYFDRRIGNNIIDRFSGAIATIDETGVTFPTLTPDVFNKTNTTYWGGTIPNTAGDNRKWLFAELSWEFMVDYATDAAHGTIFLKDFGSDVRSTLPIMVFSPARSEAQQTEIVKYINSYSFIIDENGNIVTDEDGSTYLVDGTI
jgi:hypothetical protein